MKKAKKAVKKAATGKKPRGKLPAPKPSGPQGYTADEYAKFKEYKGKFSDWGNQALKDLLKKNLQSMSGNKDVLIEKCADGATLGAIPRCPNCFGGRPKWDYKKGTYHCSGYHDDEEFKNCQSSFSKADITRSEWQH